MAENQPIIIKKKKAGGHGSHGGAWKIAYADLVTAMMAFFLVMWIIGLDEKTKVGIAEYFNNPSAFGMNKPSSRHVLPLGKQPVSAPGQMDKNEEPEANLPYEDAKRARTGIEETYKGDQTLGAIRAQTSVTLGKDGLRVELADSGGASFFAADGSLTAAGRRAVEAASNIIINAKSRVQIEGHSEATPGRSAAALDLGGQRAAAVAKALIDAGFPGDRILSVTSLGATKLRFPDQPATPANRRVVILVPYKVQTDRESTSGPAP